MFYFLICFSSPTRGIRGSGLQWLPSTSLNALLDANPPSPGGILPCLGTAAITSPGSCPCPTCTGTRLLASPSSHPPLGKQPPWEAHGQAQQDRASLRLLEHPEAAVEVVGTARAHPVSMLRVHTGKLCFPSLRQPHVTNSQLAFWKLNK